MTESTETRDGSEENRRGDDASDLGSVGWRGGGLGHGRGGAGASSQREPRET